MLLAGDALSLINPFTGEGIFYAVLSGALAGASRVSFLRWGRQACGTARRCGCALVPARLLRRLLACPVSIWPPVLAILVAGIGQA